MTIIYRRYKDVRETPTFQFSPSKNDLEAKLVDASEKTDEFVMRNQIEHTLANLSKKHVFEHGLKAKNNVKIQGENAILNS